MAAIKFPRHHIATSVVNRLLNVADELEADGLGAVSVARANVPPVPGNVSLQSDALDQALHTPPAPTIPLSQAPDPGATVSGSPLLATMLDPK